jgi:hypothetical protein
MMILVFSKNTFIFQIFQNVAMQHIDEPMVSFSKKSNHPVELIFLLLIQ